MHRVNQSSLVLLVQLKVLCCALCKGKDVLDAVPVGALNGAKCRVTSPMNAGSNGAGLVVMIKDGFLWEEWFAAESAREAL